MILSGLFRVLCMSRGLITGRLSDFQEEKKVLVCVLNKRIIIFDFANKYYEL